MRILRNQYRKFILIIAALFSKEPRQAELALIQCGTISNRIVRRAAFTDIPSYLISSHTLSRLTNPLHLRRSRHSQIALYSNTSQQHKDLTKGYYWISLVVMHQIRVINNQ